MNFSPVRWLVIVLCVAAAVSHVYGQADASPYTQTAASRDGIGKVYQGREIAQVMGHAGANWLDRPSREAEERTDKLVAELRQRLKPDAVVADIGAGSGYFSLKLAPLVPLG